MKNIFTIILFAACIISYATENNTNLPLPTDNIKTSTPVKLAQNSSIDKSNMGEVCNADYKALTKLIENENAEILSLKEEIKRLEAKTKDLPIQQPLSEITKANTSLIDDIRKESIKKTDIVELQKFIDDYNKKYIDAHNSIASHIFFIVSVLSSLISIITLSMLVFQYINFKDLKQTTEEHFKNFKDSIIEKIDNQKEKCGAKMNAYDSSLKDNIEKHCDIEKKIDKFMQIQDKLSKRYESKFNSLMQDSIEKIEYIEKRVKLTGDIEFGRVVSVQGTKSEQLRGIERLVALKSTFPKECPLFVTLARLYKRSDKLEQSIETLEEFLSNVDYKELSLSQQREIEIPVVLFNLACYFALLYQLNPERDSFKTKSFENLREVSKINDSMARAALEDDDFDHIRKNYPNELNAVING